MIRRTTRIKVKVMMVIGCAKTRSAVLYVPAQPGDSWIIETVGRVFYVQHFSTISKTLTEKESKQR